MAYRNSTEFGGLLPEATLEQSAAWSAGHPDRVTPLKAPCPIDRPGYTHPPASYLDPYFDPITVPDVASVPKNHPDRRFFLMCRKWNRGVAKQRALERRICRRNDHIPPGQYADYAARVSKRFAGSPPPKLAPLRTAVRSEIDTLHARIAQLEAAIIPGAPAAPQPEGPKPPAKLSLKQQRTLQAQRDLARLQAEQQRRQAQREQWARQRERFPTR